MNRSELIARIAAGTGLPMEKASDALRALLDAVEEAVARGECVSIAGFGTFRTHLRQPRKDCPRIGEPRKTAPKPRPVFRPGKVFLETVRGERDMTVGSGF